MFLREFKAQDFAHDKVVLIDHSYGACFVRHFHAQLLKQKLSKKFYDIALDGSVLTLRLAFDVEVHSC